MPKSLHLILCIKKSEILLVKIWMFQKAERNIFGIHLKKASTQFPLRFSYSIYAVPAQFKMLPVATMHGLRKKNEGKIEYFPFHQFLTFVLGA